MSQGIFQVSARRPHAPSQLCERAGLTHRPHSISKCLKKRTDDIWCRPQVSKRPASGAESGNLQEFWASRGHFDPTVELLPDPVETCINYLRAHSAEKEEGVFRLSGSPTETDAICAQFAAGEPVDLAAMPNLNIHSVAGSLKRWFRELPEPICTYEVSYRRRLQIVGALSNAHLYI